MIRKLILLVLVVFQFLFLLSPVLAQSEPNPEPSEPASEETDPGRLPDNNAAVETNPEDILGPIGSGKVNERCRTHVTLDKGKIIDNLDFDIPYVPGWLEGAFWGMVKKVTGGSNNLFGDIEKQINDSGSDKPCKTGSTPSTTDPDKIKKGECTCMADANFTVADDFCTKIKNTSEVGKCQACAKNGMWTAVGCVKYDFSAFITDFVFKVGISLGGMIALGCIVYAALILQTSRGDPEKIQKTREIMTSCILGLLLIIFSVFILEFIGVDLLGFGGFIN